MGEKLMLADFKRGVIAPQEGEMGVDHANATARIASSKQEIGVHKISQTEIDRVERMSIPELELEAELIARVLERKIMEQKKVG